MRYPAHVSDAAWRYDGSWPGFLCCLFETFARREIPAAIFGPEEGQMSLFGVCDIGTDHAHARRAAAGLERLGAAVRDRIAIGFLSGETGKELVLLRFARLCFACGPRVADMLGDPDVAAAFALERAVNNEAGLLLERLHFEERGGMLGAVIHPKNYVLPLLRAHFCSRLPDEDFLIFDAVHGTAMLRRGGTVQYLAMERWEPGADAAERDWQRLWKRFFKALTIEQRLNPKLQMQHVPKRLWRDMCEMQPDLTEA